MNRSLLSSASCEWETPQTLFDELNDKWHFTIDAAANADNAKCKRYYTVNENGLAQNWSGEVVWLNPPYGRTIGKWIKKAYEEAQKPMTTVVCLVPARTDTGWFHDYCTKGQITFIRGRLRFNNCKDNAPFPSMIVVFKGKREAAK